MPKSLKNNPLLSQFNLQLTDMREAFHQSGRLEDSNSKLDEITKMLCIEIVSIYDNNSSIKALKEIRTENDKSLVKALNHSLLQASKSSFLTNYDGESLLGPNPKFNFSESEYELARKLIDVIVLTFNGHIRDAKKIDDFEFINEAFSHFVRDNFRQNIEDAQYMTPIEVVNYMVAIGISSLKKRGIEKPIVCDPSCGVGSFLTHFYRTWLEEGTDSVSLVGQDKVDRMARLSLLNLYLFGIKKAHITRGNSLLFGSPLDSYNNKCDLILTNPPFGARFSFDTTDPNVRKNFPNLCEIVSGKTSTLDSELLFLDRYMSLLNPNGTLLAVLPDSVISSKGLPGLLREKLQDKYSIMSITELPAVTFAQAGTRTKTCVLEISKNNRNRKYTLMSKVESLGFEVSSKKGVPYKKEQGINELTSLTSIILTVKEKKLSDLSVLSKDPSCVSINESRLNTEGWTPSHYSPKRIETLIHFNEDAFGSDYEVISLGSIVTVPGRNISKITDPEKQKCISVLHIGDFGILNIRDMMSFNPKTPGKHCEVGDLLFSKINPRIPRAIVVPDLDYDLSCSNEFEILRPKSGYSSYEIMLLLLSEYSQNQIRSLTSGTSSSHNRIKTKELLSIKLPIPRRSSKARERYDKTINLFKSANAQLNKSNQLMYESWNELNSIFH